MRKLKLLLAVVVSSCIITGISASAEEPVSIDDIGTNSVAEESTNSTVRESNEFINKLGRYSDLSESNPTAEKAAEPIRNLASVAVQVIAYITTCGLVVRVALDLMYIGLPFVRGLLGNGYHGVSAGGGGSSGGPSMGGGSMGFSRPGIGGMGFGAGGMGGMGGMNSQAGRQATQGDGIQWVSNAALNAVATESAVGANGKVSGPFKIYAKDMIAVLVLVPVLFTLAITGAFSGIGYVIGTIVSNAIQSFGSAL
jgi:hypothetical protein